jgi:hypothetical protein
LLVTWQESWVVLSSYVGVPISILRLHRLDFDSHSFGCVVVCVPHNVGGYILPEALKGSGRWTKENLGILALPVAVQSLTVPIQVGHVVGHGT